MGTDVRAVAFAGGAFPLGGMLHFRRALLAVALTATLASARPFLVVAYNGEMLIDLDGQSMFDDYQPAGYTRAHALTKFRNAARVIAQFENGRGPDVLLLNELEVDLTPGAVAPDYAALFARYAGTTLDAMLGAKFDAAVADLPSEFLLAKALADRGVTDYRLIVADNGVAGPDGRRVDHCNGLFTRLPVRAVRSHPTTDARAILEVQLEADGAQFYVFVNHWKSGASDPATEVTRAANARTLRARLDEIFRADPNADVIVGGDLNSQYNHKQRYPAMKLTGINDVLGSQGNELAIRGKQRDLYNLWFELPATERGSDTFRGEWGTLMHLIVSRGLYDFRGVQYVDNSFAVAKFPGLNVDANGLPVRWSFNGPAGGGFSDHLPVSARFITVPDNRPDRYLALRNASEDKGPPPPPNKAVAATVDPVKAALPAASLPDGATLQTADFRGKIVFVEGKVASGERLAVEFRGAVFDVWSFDAALRTKLRTDYAAGATLRFYGEVSQYRGRWQFVIRDPSWVK
jgi:hypothetical protein